VQFCTHAAPVRAAYTQAFGVKTQHMTMNGEIYGDLFNLECGERVKDFKKMQEAKGISFGEKMEKGVKFPIVYMSADDKTAKKHQTLTESIDARSAAIDVPGHILKLAEDYSRLSKELNDAAKALHNVPNPASLGLTVFPVFADLQKRADQRIKEKADRDVSSVTRLRDAAALEVERCGTRLAELRKWQGAIDARIKELTAANVELEKAILANQSGDDADDKEAIMAKMAKAAEDKITKRENRIQIADKEAEKVEVDARVEHVKGKIKELSSQIEEYDQTIAAPGSGRKRPRDQ